MPIPFIMPKMDMDQEEAFIGQWLKKEGDHVEKGETVIIIETDKITSEVEAPATGTLARLLYHENESAPVTNVVAYILEDGETEADLPEQEDQDSEQTVIEEKNPVTRQNNRVIATPVAARLAEAENIDLHDIPATGNRITKQDIENFLEKQNQVKTRVETPATPLARRIAKTESVNLSKVNGTGPRGRVQADDVNSYVENKPEALSPSYKSTIPGNSINVSIMRQRISDKLTSSYQTTPHIFLTVEVDMSRFEANRRLMNNVANEVGSDKISLTAYMVKILAACLKQHPYLNASLEEDKIKFWEEINIGIATALSEGLIVPVIHNADKMTLNEIGTQVTQLSQKAKAGELTLQNIQGGSFTISNLGMYGIHSFTSIINPPQSAILSIGAVKRRPIVVDDEDSINVRSMMMMTLAADHRIVDGAVAANFLSDLVKRLENPELNIN